MAFGVTKLMVLVLCPAAVWAYMAAVVRRLHDRGKSAGWLVPMIVLPAFLSSFANAVSQANWTIPRDLAITAAVAEVISILFWFWPFIEPGWFPGTAGENRYGSAAQPLFRKQIAVKVV
jgi:uncharacterized membrane protein YhaH (DUF805 family)